MTRLVEIHPQNPQVREVDRVVKELLDGAIMAYPTGSGYALGCALDNAEGARRIRTIRNLSDKHEFTLVCADISQASKYAKFDNNTFRSVKGADPGKFTFILHSLPDLPRKLTSKRSTVGIRIASLPFAKQVMIELGDPILSTTLILPDESEYKFIDKAPLTNPDEIIDALDGKIDIIVDAGETPSEPSTVVDFTGSEPEIIRIGTGDPDTL